MWYEVLIPGPVLMIPILIMTTKGTHSPSVINQPADVIVTYTNHAEANSAAKEEFIQPTIMTEKEPIINHGDNKNIVLHGNLNEYSLHADSNKGKSEMGHESSTVPDNVSGMKKTARKENPKLVNDYPPVDVVFIPNEKKSGEVRNDYYLQNKGTGLHDLLGGHKTVEDVLEAKDFRVETETPVGDIIFLTGRNEEQTTEKAVPTKQDKPKAKELVIPKLNCSDLNCNDGTKSVCAEKIENYQPKLRLFKNECYFRKVNCNFRLATNRYKKVPLSRCKYIAAHTNSTRLAMRRSEEPNIEEKPSEPEYTRRQMASRRSMSMNILGEFCSHPCPTSCPDHYEPVCAVSAGQHRVFVNHCALDHNSCLFGVVWQMVPLAQCVGGKKADLQYNAGFIGWMQRLGIVDNRGRLVYEAER